LRVLELLLPERDSRRDFVGEFEPVLFLGEEDGNEVVDVLFSFELRLDFFLGEDLRKPGRTIEKMMAAPGTVVLIQQELGKLGYPCIETILLSHTPYFLFAILIYDFPKVVVLLASFQTPFQPCNV